MMCGMETGSKWKRHAFWFGFTLPWGPLYVTLPDPSQEPDQANKAAKARGSNLRVHFKHAREVCNAIKGMNLKRAKTYLQNVIDYKETVTITKFTGGTGRHAQAKNQGHASGSKGRWPQKASKLILDLVRNAEANAEMKGISTDELVISHSQANRAMQQRRRTYRAHGRINRK